MKSFGKKNLLLQAIFKFCTTKCLFKCYNFQSLSIFFEIFLFNLFYNQRKCLKFFLSKQVLVEIIRFKITVYLVIKQNIFEFSSESRVHENQHSAGKSLVCFLVYKAKSDIQAQQKFRCKYGRKHLCNQPFKHGIKGLWKLVVCYRERELADLKYQKKKLNLCKWHIPEALESPFTGLLCSYKCHASLFTKFCIETCDFMHIKCSYRKSSSQKINCDEKNWQ